jgi:hypothetical protein
MAWLRRLLRLTPTQESCAAPDPSDVAEAIHQREGLAREQRERRMVEARVDVVLRQFEALADPRLIQRLIRRPNDR